MSNMLHSMYIYLFNTSKFILQHGSKIRGDGVAALLRDWSSHGGFGTILRRFSGCAARSLTSLTGASEMVAYGASPRGWAIMTAARKGTIAVTWLYGRALMASSAGGLWPTIAPCNNTVERDAIGTSRRNAPEITIPTHLGLDRQR